MYFKSFKEYHFLTIGNGRTIINFVGFLIAAYELRDTCYKPFELMWPFYGAKER